MDILKLANQEVTKIDPKAEVILFGSRARGDFRKDSDWDFLVLLNQPLTKDLKELILEKLYDLELRTDSVISKIIHTKSDWEDRAVTPIYQIIKKEGKQAGLYIQGDFISRKGAKTLRFRANDGLNAQGLCAGLQIRLLAFWDKTDHKETLVLATHGFIKKVDKVPAHEIDRAVRLRDKYFAYRKAGFNNNK